MHSHKFPVQDICLGAFWETPQRRSLVSFSTAMLVDQMKLMTIPDPRVASSKGYPSSFPLNRQFTIAVCTPAEVLKSHLEQAVEYFSAVRLERLGIDCGNAGLWRP